MSQIIPTKAIAVVQSYFFDSELWLEVDCEDYDAFKQLPKAGKVDNTEVVRTGWNSDKYRAYYRSAKPGELLHIIA